jgi:hypothetical protein
VAQRRASDLLGLWNVLSFFVGIDRPRDPHPFQLPYRSAKTGLRRDLNSAQGDRPECRDQILVELCTHAREYGIGVTWWHA